MPKKPPEFLLPDDPQIFESEILFALERSAEGFRAIQSIVTEKIEEISRIRRAISARAVRIEIAKSRPEKSGK